MEQAAQRDMELHFGRSFDHVRVHTDAEAAELARQLDAQAYSLVGTSTSSLELTIHRPREAVDCWPMS
jgi:acyl dehydratase